MTTRSTYPSLAAGAASPRVSCILPTADRLAFALEAIRCFDRQDFPSRELVVVDDGEDSRLASSVQGRTDVQYLRLDRRYNLGEKRNLACQAARGEIIVHWDDDDWSSPARVGALVAELDREPGDIVGQEELYFLDLDTAAAWLFVCPPHNRGRWLAGGSLAYRKALWQRHLFLDRHQGEDWNFLLRVLAEQKLRVLPRRDLYVATIHARNTCVKRTAAPEYRPFPTSEIATILGADFATYRALAPRRQPSPTPSGVAA